MEVTEFQVGPLKRSLRWVPTEYDWRPYKNRDWTQTHTEERPHGDMENGPNYKPKTGTLVEIHADMILDFEFPVCWCLFPQTNIAAIWQTGSWSDCHHNSDAEINNSLNTSYNLLFLISSFSLNDRKKIKQFVNWAGKCRVVHHLLPLFMMGCGERGNCTAFRESWPESCSISWIIWVWLYYCSIDSNC